MKKQHIVFEEFNTVPQF